MRKIAAGLFISLDGVVEFPERWGFQYLDNDLNKEIVAGIAQADAVLMGRGGDRGTQRQAQPSGTDSRAAIRSSAAGTSR